MRSVSFWLSADGISVSTMSDTVDVQEPILRRHLQDLKHEDAIWSGYLKSEEELKQLERSLAAANLKFAVRSSRRKTGE